MREVIELDPAWSYSILQSFYILPERRGLYPNRVFVRKKGQELETFFEINSWGLKGPEPQAGKPVLAMWGDSVVFGYGRAWVEMLNDLQGGFCAVNGGLEGDDPVNVLRRMWDINREHKIDVNIFFPGWHARPGYAHDPPSEWMPKPSLAEALPKILEQKAVPNLILCTIPTWLSPEMLMQDVAAHFNAQGSIDDTYFTFWGNEVYNRDYALRIYRHIQERNDLLRRAAEKYGLGLLDLEKRLRFSTMEKAKEYFFDVCHFRSTVYAELSQILLEELKGLGVVA